MKRVFLSGHGYFQEQIQSTVPGPIEIKKPQGPTETGAATAQLRPYQYIKLLETLRDSGCSFLYVKSCYSSGFNALTAQSESFYEEKNIFSKFKLSEAIPFIIVTESTPDTSSGFTATQIEQFFRELNTFFEQEKNKLRDYLNVKNLTCSDKQLLRGSYLNPPVTLIQQKPWLIGSFENILQNVRIMLSINYSSIKFPGAPFFRVGLQTFEQNQQTMLEKNKSTQELINTLTQLQEQCTAQNNTLKLLQEGTPEYQKALKTSQKFHQEIDPKIDKLESLLAPLAITYPFLQNHELLFRREKDRSIHINYPVKDVLLYPSIINVPITVDNSQFSAVSMIAGRAQHYLESLSFNTNPTKKFNDIGRIFTKIQKDSRKLFCIKTIHGFSDKPVIFNVFIKTTAGKANIIYQNQDGKFYDSSGKEVDVQSAKQTIKQWILETTPAKEAVFEATAGIENIYKFRVKINQIFPNMFTPEELDKKSTATKKS